MSLRKIETFKERWNELHRNFNNGNDNQAFLMRLRRAISWLDRVKHVKKEKVKGKGEDFDTQFIFLWIAFNALYARDPRKFINDEQNSSKIAFKKYFNTLLNLDAEARERVFKIVENNIRREIDKLLNNKFVSAEFWNYHQGVSDKAYRHKWVVVLKGKLDTRDTDKILGMVFTRLYVLRNQLMHGGATWKGGLNHPQLREGTKIMLWLLPVFIDLMLENPEANWGEVFYPRMGERSIDPFILT